MLVRLAKEFATSTSAKTEVAGLVFEIREVCVFIKRVEQQFLLSSVCAQQRGVDAVAAVEKVEGQRSSFGCVQGLRTTHEYRHKKRYSYT